VYQKILLIVKIYFSPKPKKILWIVDLHLGRLIKAYTIDSITAQEDIID